MDSLVKCGNGYGGYGYGYGYGYGNSKPQMNYNRQNTESVTTVVTEINRMTVNDKPSCYGGGGGDVQKQACKVEAFEEHDEAYNGAVAVQKHDEYRNEDKYGEVIDAEYGAHYGGGAAALKKQQGYGYKQEAYGETEAAAGYGGAHYGAGGMKQGYNYKQEAYGDTEAAAGYGGAHYGAGGGVKKQGGYSYTQEACGESNAGYGAHHGGAGGAVKTYGYGYNQKAAYGGAGYGAHHGGYDQQAAYGGAIGAAVQQQAYKHKDAASKMNGSQQKMYGYGETAVDAAGAGYGAHCGGGAVQQQHGYHKDAYGYGAAAGGKVKKNGYQYQEAYGGTGAGAGGYGAHYGGGAAAVQKHGYMQDVYESETESESDESDCDEAFPPRGGVQHSYGAYKQEKHHGAGNLGGVHRYESYETREELGGGRRYESYQSSVQYTGGSGGGGGGGGYATCSPIKNRHLLRYGA